MSKHPGARPIASPLESRPSSPPLKQRVPTHGHVNGPGRSAAAGARFLDCSRNRVPSLSPSPSCLPAQRAGCLRLLPSGCRAIRPRPPRPARTRRRLRRSHYC
jgi:hypothetical protein